MIWRSALCPEKGVCTAPPPTARVPDGQSADGGSCQGPGRCSARPQCSRQLNSLFSRKVISNPASAAFFSTLSQRSDLSLITCSTMRNRYGCAQGLAILFRYDRRVDSTNSETGAPNQHSCNFQK